MKKVLFLSAILAATVATFAQKTDDKGFVANQLDKRYAAYCDVARTIWTTPELGYLESKSSKVLVDMLRKEGFEMQTGVAGMPTSFVAKFGSGKPVIGILAEFDALPGLSQDTVPYKKPLIEGGNGHGCGHNLFGTASAAAGIALKDWLTANKRQGTVIVYGTPAEEGGGGKVFMTRDGFFDGLDAAIHWHPSDRNDASSGSSLAVKGAIFKFYGRSSHAAAAPQVGRSALDGAESMNYMVNMMREHMDERARIHYIIKKGGLAANVVPDYVEMEYYVRHPNVQGVLELFDRVVKCGEGAAIGTETKMAFDVNFGLYDLLPNDVLAKAMHDNLTRVGGVKYSPEEAAFASKIRESFPYKIPPISYAADIQPFANDKNMSGSTDVGDVSYVVPTVGVYPATWVPGTAAHTWQAVAADGIGIGFKGMMVAAKTMAMTGIDLFTTPELIVKAKAELQKRTDGFKYKALVGDRKPPLDYRKGL